MGSVQAIWTTLIYQPLYNGLIFLVNTVAFGDLGLAVIILTIFVKVLLFPITKRSIESQRKLQALQDELDAIKRDNPNQAEQSKKTFELYKKNKVNPFSGCLLLLIQFPIIIALYYVFLKGLSEGSGLLYSFIHTPEHMNTMFLGFIDLTKPNIAFAILAGLSQFFQMQISLKNQPAPSEGTSFQAQLAKNMQFQMKYILPVLIAFIALKLSAAVALYWITSNIISMAQEYVIRKKPLEPVRIS